MAKKEKKQIFWNGTDIANTGNDILTHFNTKIVCMVRHYLQHPLHQAQNACARVKTRAEQRNQLQDVAVGEKSWNASKPRRNKRLHLCTLLSCSSMKFRSCSFATVRHKTPKSEWKWVGHWPFQSSLCAHVVRVCVRACVSVCLGVRACVLSVRASRPTLASALHQRPSIIEQKLCDAQGNEIVYFYHSRIPHGQHTLPACTAIHRHRCIAFFFFPGATMESEGKRRARVQREQKLGETVRVGGWRGAQ